MIFRFCVYIPNSQRVDMYLSALFCEFSRSYIQKLIDSGKVSVNGQNITKNKKIASRDEIILEITLESLDILPQDIPLDIIFQDENIALVNKDAGMNTHPTPGPDGKKDTLVNALLYHVKDLSGIGGVERPGIVHRLDKDTSGLIMIAKTDTMMQKLQKMLHDRNGVEKYYLAIVAGIFPEEKMTIDMPIGRHPTQKIKMTTRFPISPKTAVSHVERLEYIDDKYSLLRVKIDTGRTHQIRVHLSALGFPIVWDAVYGKKEVNETVSKKYNITRQMLHSHELRVNLYGKMQTFFAPLKEDMLRILEETEFLQSLFSEENQTV